MAKATGRRKGSRNRSYFFINNRGWVANVNGKRVPLEYPNGDRMRDERTPPADVKAAYFRLMAAPADQVETTEVSMLSIHRPTNGPLRKISS